MTLKIERESARGKTVVRLVGRLCFEHLDELKRQVEDTASEIVLDLEAVTLVDVEVVRFLNCCERSGVELSHCSPYIQEWMLREQEG
jgi:anti-anti-sigma regulatory factor